MKGNLQVNWKTVSIILVLSLVLSNVMNHLPGFTIHEATNKQEVDLKYQDLASLMLACVGVIVTALGVGIALLSIWGYKEIKDTALKNAEEHIKHSIQDESGVLHKVIGKQVAGRMYRNIKGRESSEDYPNPNSEHGD